MKALVLLAPNELRIEERPVPAPGPGEVLLRVAYAGICHTDLYTMRGGYTDMSYPTVLGHEFSGIVESCGPGVTHLQPGDQVTTMGFVSCGLCPACVGGCQGACRYLKAMPRDIEGPFQELVTIPASAVFALPGALSLEEAALAEPASCAYNAVQRAALQPGERVVIHGVGPIGLFAVQAAALRQPALLLALDLHPMRLETALKMGATATVNIRESDPCEAVMDMTAGDGADVAVLCGGGEDAWDVASRTLAIGGRVVVEAMPSTPEAMWRVKALDFTQKQISYAGVGAFSIAQFRTVLGLLAAEKITARPLITHRLGLDDYREAFEVADQHKDTCIKVIFDMHGKGD